MPLTLEMSYYQKRKQQATNERQIAPAINLKTRRKKLLFFLFLFFLLGQSHLQVLLVLFFISYAANDNSKKGKHY